MKKDMKKNKMNFGLAFAVAGAIAGVAATAIAVFKQRKREQVYHEAEMKAMDELDDLNAEDENACAGCECLEDCAVAGGGCCSADEQIELNTQEAETVKTEEETAEPEPSSEEDKPAE